jgi:predicted RNA-binding protein with RPS1 domain
VTGKVKTVDPKGAEIDLGEDIIGYLRASEISRDRVEDARNVLKEGDEVTAVVVNVDRKTRNIQLSIKPRTCRRAGPDGQPEPAVLARKRRHDQPGRAAARQAGQQRQASKATVQRCDAGLQSGSHRVQLLFHDPKRPRRRTGRPDSAS